MGAALGVVVTGLVLIELLGFRNTLAVGCGCNLLLAVTGLVAGFLFRKDAMTRQAPRPFGPSKTRRVGSLPPRVVCPPRSCSPPVFAPWA